MNHGGLTAGRIADLVGGERIGPSDPVLVGVAPLDRAGPDELSFLASRRFLGAFRATRAGAVLVPADLRLDDGPECLIRVADPHAALSLVLPKLYPGAPPAWGVHATARLGPGARWAGRIAVGAGTVIEAGVRFGADCRIGEGVAIGAGTRFGDQCTVGPGATIAPGVEIGDGAEIHAGARIGTPGFGYASGPDGPRPIPHVGGCRLGHRVRVGANTTIDRGSIADTIIGDDTKLDNLVQVGHNTRVGRRCFIMAQVGMAGSTVLEDDVVLAGQAGLAGHLTVGRGARVAAQGGVIGDVPAGATVSGYPARPHRQVLREAAALRRLPRLVSALDSSRSP